MKRRTRRTPPRGGWRTARRDVILAVVKALLVALSLLPASITSAAPCARDPLLPAALPAVGCPTLVVPSPCHWCPQGDTFLDLHHDVDRGALAGAWIDALRASGWTVRIAHAGALNAARGASRVWLRFDPGRTPSRTVIRLGFSP